MKNKIASYLLPVVLLGCMILIAEFTIKAAGKGAADDAHGEKQPTLLAEAKVNEHTADSEENSNTETKDKPEESMSLYTERQRQVIAGSQFLEIRADSYINCESSPGKHGCGAGAGEGKSGVQSFGAGDPFTFRVYADVALQDKLKVELAVWTEQKQEKGKLTVSLPLAENPVQKTCFEMRPTKEGTSYMAEIPYHMLGVYNSENGAIHYQVYVRNDRSEKVLSAEPMSVQAYGGYIDGAYEGYVIESRFNDMSINGGGLDVYGSCAVSSRLQITDYVYIHGDSTLWLETQDYGPALYLKGNTRVRGDGWESKIILSRKLKIRSEVGAIALESGFTEIANISFSNEDDYIEGVSKASHGIWGDGHTMLNITNCKLSSPSTGSIIGTYGSVNVKDSTFYKGVQGIHFNGAYDNLTVRTTNCTYRNLAQAIQGGTPNGKKAMSLYLEGVNHFVDIGGEAIDVSDGEYLSCGGASSTTMEQVGSGVKVSNFTKAALRNITMNGRSIQSGAGIIFWNTRGETSAALIKNFHIGLEIKNESSVKGVNTNIQNNLQGVLNAALYEHTGGSISGNQREGVNHEGTAFWLTGGDISGNGRCDVYLDKGKVIDWKKSEAPKGAIIRILSKSTELGTVLVRNQFQENGHMAAGEVGEDYFAAAHGKRFTGRGGNRNGREESHLVLSQYYHVNYDKNSDDDISNMPQNEKKYWEEDFRISSKEPANDTCSFVKFMGWDLNEDSKPDVFPAGILKENKDVQAKAVWRDKIFVDYHSNEDEKSVKTDIITSESLKHNNGIYKIRKNTGYTNYVREGYTYAGFDLNDSTSPLQAAYKEEGDNSIHVSDMLKHIQETAGASRLPIYAIWDKKPEILFTGDHEFYEGTEVDRQSLKTNVTVQDKEEGDITDRLKIVEIQYADGKLIDGKPTKGDTVKFWGEMGEQDRLDTWFMALDKEKSPVTHTVVYEAADSSGGISSGRHNVLINYNEFPEIEARERYFSIEEARRGDITEESLLKEGLTSKKVWVSDKEEDSKNPDYMKTRIYLEQFVPEEFTRIDTDTMILLELVARDSMGPEGEGKEKRGVLKVYVKQSGEIPQKPNMSRVRFFDEKNYRKNEGKETVGSAAERESEEVHNGGFHKESVWYTSPQYKEVITRSFDPGTGPMFVYSFSYDECLKVKEFIEKNGIGNAHKETALAEFAERFMNKQT